MRRATAIIAAKTTAALSRRLGRGGGTALPGLVAERIDPEIVSGLAGRLGLGSILVTGTNGKTTTARLVRRIVEAAGLRAVANRAGSNMMRGIASALIDAAGWRGSANGAASVGVFEVDEATVPLVARAVKPRAVLFTNLFRDQLDRYGEVETVAALWREAAASFEDGVTLVCNADDPAVASLRKAARGRVLFFGVEDVSQGQGRVEHAADARWCSECGAELEYAAIFYGHLGHWRCPKCDNARPTPDVAVTAVRRTDSGTLVMVRTPSGEFEVEVPLSGLYNVYNVLAAAAAGVALGIEDSPIHHGVTGFTAAFGRQERLAVRGRDVHVILAKNPAGLNQVLHTITTGEGDLNLLVFLNDNIADGRDISWIWDVDFERLAGRLRSLTVSGTRGWDMALRLKYAGLGDAPNVEEDTTGALREALGQVPEGGTLYVIPTYTAMLEVRNILGRWAGRGAFWEGE